MDIKNLYYGPNISKEVLDKADELGLGYIDTGGGCDYICCMKNHDIIIAMVDDVGSPLTLAEKARIYIYNEATDDMWWEHGVSFEVETTLKAMEILKSFDDGDISYF